MKKYNEMRKIGVDPLLLSTDRFVKDSDGFYYETGENLAFRFGKPLFIGRGKGRKMKTSKEMQLKIIDKMRENVESGNWLFDGIQYSSSSLGWIDKENNILDFMGIEYRIKPQTITINGVEIPKPLSCSEILSDEDYYYVENSESLYNMSNGTYIKWQGIRFAYETKEEAITASKALFGLD